MKTRLKTIIYTYIVICSIWIAYPVYAVQKDTTPPIIKLTNPVNNKINVELNQTITIKYNENILQGKKFPNIILADERGRKIDFKSKITKDTLSIKTLKLLKDNMKYQLKIPIGAIKDKLNNYTNKQFILTFRTTSEIKIVTPLPTPTVTPIETYKNIDINNFEDVFHIDSILALLPFDEYKNILNPIKNVSENYIELNKTSYFTSASLSFKKKDILADFDRLECSYFYSNNHTGLYYNYDNDINLYQSIYQEYKNILKLKYGEALSEDYILNPNAIGMGTAWKGIEIKYDKYQLALIITAIPQYERMTFTSEELERYLVSKFSSLNTVIGETNFNFKIVRNTTDFFVYDYKVEVLYDFDFFEGAMHSIKYTKEQREVLKNQLKDHQEKIGRSLIALEPNKKFYGGYYNGYYKYPNLKVDYIITRYFSWCNFDGEPVATINGSNYDSINPSYFRWYDFMDDKL